VRLTNEIRDAFVSAVMNDVPQDDKATMQIEAHKIVLDAALAKTPAAVRKLWVESADRVWIQTNTHSFRHKRQSCFDGVAYPADNRYAALQLSPKDQARVDALCDAVIASDEKRAKLRSTIRATAYGFTTRKQLAEALPEFAKYLPEALPPVDRTVPVLANVVAEFVQAGWPKGKKKK
jgi:hypothetical protein